MIFPRDAALLCVWCSVPSTWSHCPTTTSSCVNEANNHFVIRARLRENSALPSVVRKKKKENLSGVICSYLLPFLVLAALPGCIMKHCHLAKHDLKSVKHGKLETSLCGPPPLAPNPALSLTKSGHLTAWLIFFFSFFFSKKILPGFHFHFLQDLTRAVGLHDAEPRQSRR